MSESVPLQPANVTHAQGVPDTGSLEAAGPSRTAGNLPEMPSAQSTLPAGSKPEVASSLADIKAAGDKLASNASPAGALD